MYGSAIDMGFLPPQFRGDVQLFFPTGTVSTLWQTWTKPRGITMIYMIAISGGGGGGGGFTRATGVAGGGGGSGACSGMATLMMPAIFLPDSLKISVGPGGQGGAAGTTGGAGTNSYITLGAGLTTGITIPNVILASGATAPGGGAGGSGASGGAAGIAPTVATIAAVGPMGKLGFFPNTGTVGNNGYVGLVGQIGGAQTGAIGTVYSGGWNVLPFTPGASGAGINTAVQGGFLGGTINIVNAVDFADGAFSPPLIIPGGTAGSAILAGGNGGSGIRSMKPFLHTGGAGGGSSDAQIGGIGGAGGIGCGGGGGGAGTTGGRGGNGGDGMVAIICW